AGWNAIATNLTETTALLLTDETKIRFIPAPNFNGKPGSITGRLMDSSHPDFSVGKLQDARFTTSGGPFSPKTISRTLTINPLNDAPSIVSEAQVNLPTFLEDTPFTTENAPTVDTLFTSAFEDSIDRNNLNQNTFIGIAIIQDFAARSDDREADAQIGSEKGEWEVYDIRNAQWVALPNDLSQSNAYLVPKTAQIRFTPSANYNGELPPLEAYLVDNGSGQALGLGQRIDLTQTGVGGVTRYTAETVTLNGSIEAVNDLPPAVGDSSPINLSENGQDEDSTTPPAQSVAALFASRFGSQITLDGDQFGYDPASHGAFDDATFWGVLIKDIPASEIGVWEYSADGANWTAVGGWSAGSGLYLPQAYQLRFRQTTANYNDAMTGADLGPAHPLTAYLVDGSITDTDIGAQLQTQEQEQAQAIAGIAIATPTPNRLGESAEASPISPSSLMLEQAINAVNDAPDITEVGDLLLNGTLVSEIAEDETGEVYLSGIAIADIDANEIDPDGELTLTLSVDSGLLTADPTIPNGLIAAQISDSGTDSIQLTGTLSAINTTLAAATAIRYQAEPNFNGEVTLALAISDNANVGQGGAQTAETTRTITITPVNDEPTLSVDNSSLALSVDEDQTLFIEGIVIDDVDAQQNPDGALTVTLSVLNGMLNVKADVEGGVTPEGITYNQTGSEAVLVGSVAQIQTTLQAEDSLSYQGNPNFSGEDTLSITVSDSGNTGTGGPLSSDPALTTIVVSPRNDAPIATGEVVLPTIARNALDLEGQTVAELFESYFDDSADNGTLAGIAVISNRANAQSEGKWQYSTDDGGNWRNLPALSLSPQNAFALNASARLRFMPAASYAGKPGGLETYLIDNSAIVANAELGIDVSMKGATTPYSEDVVALSTRVVIENAGSVILTAAQQQLLVEIEDVQMPIRFGGAQVFESQFSGWEILAADTIDGQNQVLWKNVETQNLGLWTMDDSWNFVSGEALTPNALEILGFQDEFNIDLSSVIEETGAVALLQDIFGNLLVDDGSQTPISFNGAQAYASQFAGWEILAAETIDNQNQVLWKNESTQQLGLWMMDENWNFVSGEALSPTTLELLAFEESFGVSLYNAVEEVGAIALFEDAFGRLFVEGGVTIKNNDTQVNANQYAGWEVLAADTIDSQNQVLWKNESTQQLGLWRMDEIWNFVSGEALSPTTLELLAFEESFGVSLHNAVEEVGAIAL
ncbi:MAG: Ig-like domain-containing protein, partial [Phormidesmis sp.]